MFATGKKLAILIVAAATLTVAGCGGGDEASSVDPRTWPDQWCTLQIGDTPERAVELMGEPTNDHRESSGSMSWDWREYQFNAFLGSDDRIRQLDINATQLSMHQVRMIGCAGTRSIASPDGVPPFTDPDDIINGTAP